MIRMLMAAALAVVPMAAQAQSSQSGDSVGGIIVEGQPNNAYVMRVPTAGREVSAVRQDIWETAWTACDRAPRTGNVMDTRPFYMQWCANEAASNALRQYDTMLKNPRPPGAFVDVSTYGP